MSQEPKEPVIIAMTATSEAIQRVAKEAFETLQKASQGLQEVLQNVNQRQVEQMKLMINSVSTNPTTGSMSAEQVRMLKTALKTLEQEIKKIDEVNGNIKQAAHDLKIAERQQSPKNSPMSR